MRKLAIILALAIGGCEPDEPWTGTEQLGEPWTGTVQLDQPFDLPFSGIATFEAERAEITFATVVEDSRCPADHKCQLPGYVVIELEIETESRELATVMLSSLWSYPFNPATIDTLGYRISLLGIAPPAAKWHETIPNDDYVATIEVMEPWQEGTINLLDADSYGVYSHRTMAATQRDTMWIDDDSLVVKVRYGGGCTEHDFYLIGACPPDMANPVTLGLGLFHDGHGDTCEAWLAATLKFDLAPLRTCGLSADSIEIHVINAIFSNMTTVMFGL